MGEELTSTKRLEDFLGRWGARSLNIAKLWSTVVPVAVVDRFRDDSEGSIRAVPFEHTGVPLEFTGAALFVDSSDPFAPDLEIHGLWVGIDGRASATESSSLSFSMWNLFTPIAPYNPVLNNTVGPFANGLMLDKDFTFGRALCLTGTNPVAAPFQGLIFKGERDTLPLNIIGRGRYLRFDPPLRVYRGVTLAVQTFLLDPAKSTHIIGSFFYTERPRANV